jgi:hypothetical protein
MSCTLNVASTHQSHLRRKQNFGKALKKSRVKIWFISRVMSISNSEDSALQERLIFQRFSLLDSSKFTHFQKTLSKFWFRGIIYPYDPQHAWIQLEYFGGVLASKLRQGSGGAAPSGVQRSPPENFEENEALKTKFGNRERRKTESNRRN